MFYIIDSFKNCTLKYNITGGRRKWEKEGGRNGWREGGREEEKDDKEIQIEIEIENNYKKKIQECVFSFRRNVTV